MDIFLGIAQGASYPNGRSTRSFIAGQTIPKRATFLVAIHSKSERGCRSYAKIVTPLEGWHVAATNRSNESSTSGQGVQSERRIQRGS